MDWVYPAVLVVLEDHVYVIKGRNVPLRSAVVCTTSGIDTHSKMCFFSSCDREL